MMRLYLAGADTSGYSPHLEIPIVGGLAFLVSYWYVINSRGWDIIEYANNNNIPVFLDSGAFSAMTLGSNIDINEYIEFCKDYKDRFEVIASLDVIGNWENTEINHIKMRDAGINSIPCFHVREPFEFLERLLKDNDYIAVGVAGNQRLTTKVMTWLTKVFSIRNNINPDCKIHGFALTSGTVMSNFDWYSVDSTAWLAGRRFNRVYKIDGNKLFSFSDRDNRFKMEPEYKLLLSNKPTREQVLKMDVHNALKMIEWVQMLARSRTKANVI